jgi:1-aminocyclopropane-1-carboxylate deaminase/D-cysteine desulfhydrase-like pyridoxal-dependent ACC family enzyme
LSRHNDFRELEPIERRTALMRAAGMSENVIARFLDVDYVTVGNILKRPRVARYLFALEATFVEDIKDSAKHLDAAIMNEAKRAFAVERDVMERLYAMEDNVRAQLGAASTAQDILDRAGKRAPTKIQGEIVHTIDAEALAHVATVLQEVHGKPVIDVTPNGNGHGNDQA